MHKAAVIITSAAVVATLAGGAAAYAGTQASPVAATQTRAGAVSAAPTATTTPVAPATPAPAATPGAADDDLDAAIAAALAEVGGGTVVDADRDDNVDYSYEIDVRRESGGVVEVKLDAEFAIVSVGQDDDDRDDSSDDRDDATDDSSSGDDEAVTDAQERKRAADAALAEVGKGTVVSVEYSDDADHVFEVEVELGDGEDVDVELDADFAVVKVD